MVHQQTCIKHLFMKCWLCLSLWFQSKTRSISGVVSSALAHSSSSARSNPTKVWIPYTVNNACTNFRDQQVLSSSDSVLEFPALRHGSPNSQCSVNQTSKTLAFCYATEKQWNTVIFLIQRNRKREYKWCPLHFIMRMLRWISAVQGKQLCH